MIVFDVDGVILDFNTKFVEYHNQLYSEQLTSNPNDWNFEWRKDPKILSIRIDNFVNTNPILPLLDIYWESFLKKCRNKYKVSIVTAYPNQINRIENLKLYNIEYDDIYFIAQANKADFIKQLNPIYVFDDCPEIIDKLNIKIYAPRKWNYLKKFQNNDKVVLYDKLEDIKLV
jgi:hypothetical protein